MGLAVSDASAVAESFALGATPRLTGPVARGQLGQVWRLETDLGTFAVKEWFADPDLTGLTVGVGLQERLWAAGVPTPEVVRTPAGDVSALVAGTRVRVLEWVDLCTGTRRLPPTAVGRVLGTMHAASRRSSGTVVRWHSEGIGETAWRLLHARAVAEEAPFAANLGAMLEELIAVEAVVEPPGQLLECHRDLWADNLLATEAGDLCVVDFENVGPADPSHELGMVLFEFGLDDPERVRELHRAYVAAGGPARVTRRADFSMLVATLGHLAQLAGNRWLGTDDRAVRAESEALTAELLDDPVTLPRIDRILAALHG